MTLKTSILITAESAAARAEIERMKGSLAGLEKAGSALKSALAGYFTVAGAGQFVRAMVDAQAAADKLRATLKFATGDAAAGFAYMRRTAEALGLDLGTAGASFAKLAAAAKGTALEGAAVRDIFEAVAKATTVMGLSAAEADGALLAVSQMISKGTVSAEELRGQLGERLPGAFQVAARAMGVTTAELGKMLEAGSIATTDFLPRFAAELVRTLGDNPASAAQQAQAQINRLSSAWMLFKQSLADSGWAKTFVDGMKQVTGALSDAAQAMDEARKRGWGALGQNFAGVGGAVFGHETQDEARASIGDDGRRTKEAAAIQRDIDLLRARVKGDPGNSEFARQDLEARRADLAALQAEMDAIRKTGKVDLPTRESLAAEAGKTAEAVAQAFLDRYRAHRAEIEKLNPVLAAQRAIDDYKKKYEGAFSKSYPTEFAAGLAPLNKKLHGARIELAKDPTAQARLAAVKAAAESEFRITKDALERAGRAYDDAFEDRLVSLRDYYLTKTRLDQEALDVDIRGLQAQRDAQQRVASSTIDPAERLRAGAEVEKLNADIEIAVKKRFDAEVSNARRARDAERELREELVRVRDETLDLTGAATAADRRAAIERQFKPLLDKARANTEGFPGGDQAVLKLIDLRASSADLSALESKFTGVLGSMQVKEQSLNIQRQSGIITETQARAEILRLYRETAAEVEGLIPDMERLATAIGNPEAINRVGQLRNRVAELKITTNETAVAINGALGDGLKTLFKDVASGSKTAKEAMLDFLNSIGNKMLDILSNRFAENLLGDLGKSGGSGSSGGFGGWLTKLLGFHAGGVVGASGGSFARSVPLSAILAAPRYHSGGLIGGNEQVIIAEKGEEVLTANDPRHIRNGRGGVQTVKAEIINNGTPQKITGAEMQFDLKGAVLRIMTEDLAGNGSFSRANERTYGLNRAAGAST